LATLIVNKFGGTLCSAAVKAGKDVGKIATFYFAVSLWR
jgi:hypothetical protein